MTATIVLAVLLLLAALAFLAWTRRRDLAGRRLPVRATAASTRGADAYRFFGLVAHELRTPLGAIVGYAELLGDGLLGPLPERASDAVRRIGISGAQLRHLVDGLSDLVVADAETTLDLQEVGSAETADAIADSARALAAGRSVSLDVAVPPELPFLWTDSGRIAAALDLAVGAAVRASPGASLRLSFANEAGVLAVRVEGTALDPQGDLPRQDSGAAPASGPALRLAMADRILQLLGGSLALEGAAPTTLLLRVPSLPRPASKQ